MQSVFQGKEKFPKFDLLHANCGMSVVYRGSKCAEIFKKVEATIQKFNPEPDVKGTYQMIESKSDDYIWATRTTPVKKYVDDILFEFEQMGEDCRVNGKSRSRTHSFYDHKTNFCNIYNVHRYIGGFTDVKTSKCLFVPKDPDQHCLKY